MAFSLARNGDRPVPELVACTGAEHLGGFTLFQVFYLSLSPSLSPWGEKSMTLIPLPSCLQRDLPTRTKRKLHAIAGSKGMWSFPIRQEVKVNGMRIEKPSSFLAEHDTIIVSTDATPAPGLSRVSLFSSLLLSWFLPRRFGKRTDTWNI